MARFLLRGSISRILFLNKKNVVIHLESFLQNFSSDLPKKLCRNQSLFLLFGLAPSGVYNANYIAIKAVCSYHTISPLPAKGGIFSVALSLGFPPLEVIQHFFLWSPDFPLKTATTQPSQPKSKIFLIYVNKD